MLIVTIWLPESDEPAAMSEPSVTQRPSFSICRTGAMPLHRLMLESGQCATTTPA